MKTTKTTLAKSAALANYVAVGCLLLLGSTHGVCQTKSDDVPAFNTVQYNSTSWIEYKPAGGRFSVLFPGMPAEQIQTIETVLGKLKLHMSMLLVQHKETFAFCLTAYNDLPVQVTGEAAVRKVLDGGRDELFSAKPSRKLIAEKDITLDSHLGREIRFEDGDLNFVQRVFVVTDRTYQVTVGVPNTTRDDEVVKFHDEVRQKFFASFKVLSSNR